MTPEAQRIAIAEACGWWSIRHLYGYPNKDATGVKKIPDYLTDLNAMHEAEKVLTYKQLEVMHARLAEVLSKQKTGNRRSANDFMWHATAAQRAEAFLRTIGKWDDAALNKEDKL